jgi:hypothetical protein
MHLMITICPAHGFKRSVQRLCGSTPTHSCRTDHEARSYLIFSSNMHAVNGTNGTNNGNLFNGPILINCHQISTHRWMNGLRTMEPLLIEAEFLHAGLCLGLMCSPSWIERGKLKQKKRTKQKNKPINQKSRRTHWKESCQRFFSFTALGSKPQDCGWRDLCKFRRNHYWFAKYVCS